MSLDELAVLAKTFADFIVYVWVFSIGMSLLLGKSLNQRGLTFRLLPGFWSPPVLAPMHRTLRYPTENTEFFLLLAGLLLLRGTRDLVLVSIVALLADCCNGILFSRLRKPFHYGNLLFTYLGFLLLRGYFEVGIIAILMTIVVGCVCSKMLWGMVPMSNSPIWKGHLLSFTGGAIAARWLDHLAVSLPASQLW
jgi:hypothetical protein